MRPLLRKLSIYFGTCTPLFFSLWHTISSRFSTLFESIYQNFAGFFNKTILNDKKAIAVLLGEILLEGCGIQYIEDCGEHFQYMHSAVLLHCVEFPRDIARLFFFKYTTILYHSGLTSHYFHVVVWVTPLNECAVLQSYKEENAHKAAFSTVEKNFPPMYLEFSRLVKHGNNLYRKGLVDMCHLASSKLALNAGLFLLCEWMTWVN